MTAELFTGANLATTTVVAGGSTTPSPGTVENWTVSSSALFPAASSSAGQFHIADTVLSLASEMIAVTNVAGVTWTVVRGAYGTTPVAHSAGFKVAQVVTAGFLTAVSNTVTYLNAVTAYGADPIGATDSTTAIQAALSAALAVYLPAGTYKISSALTLQTGQVLAGAGMGATTITQTTANTHCLSGTDVGQVTVRDLKLTGTGAGTGNGINIVPSSNSNVGYIDLINVFATSWGGTAIHLDTPIVSHLRKVLATASGAGILLSNSKGSPTSVTFDSCYANSNTGAGYELDGALYCVLNGCAADSNATSYLLSSCQAITLNGCGAESFSTAGWEFTGCTDCHLNGARSHNGAGIVAWVTGSTSGQLITNLVETGPAGGATACIQTDSGTSVVITNPVNVTANSLTPGTAALIDATMAAAAMLTGAGAFLAPTGALAETCPRAIVTASSSAALVSGTVYMRAVGLGAGIPVQHLTLYTAAGNVATQASITHGWYALCDSTRHILAISTDQVAAAVWTVINTAYTLAVAGSGGSTYITTYDGLYYIAEMVAVSAGNMPQFAVSGSMAAGPGAAAPVLYGLSSSGQTTPPSVGTQLASVTFANSNAFYGDVT